MIIIWKNMLQRMKKMTAIVIALSIGMSLAVAQPVYAGTGVSKISIKMPVPIKGSDKNQVVIPKGEKTTFVVKLTGYSGKPLYQSDCKVVFTSSSKTKATISDPGYKKKNSNVYWADVQVKPNAPGKFELKAKVKKKNLYVYWTVCISTPIDRIAINKEVGDDIYESGNGPIMVGDKLIARGVDPDDYVLTTALVNFKWYVIGDDGTRTEVPTGVRDEELVVTEEMVGHRLMVEARPSSYLTGSASYETSEAVIEYRERLEEPDAPKNLEEQKCSAVGKKDGKITGVTTAMEYQLEGARIWTPVTGDEITGLAEGTYYVRYMATDKALASKKTKVRVGAVATVSAPKFSPMGGSFPEPVDVAISSATKGADIYYTLDDSEPTVDSEKYSGPIHISETTTVRAIAVKEGSNNSSVVSATYEVIEEKEGPEITKEPKGISELMYDGKEHALITPGEVKDGEMYYAVRKAGDDENEEVNADALQYQKEIPTATEPGIYYVWYKAVDTEKNIESEPELVIVTIYDRIRIHFHANGGTGIMDDQDAVTHDETKLNANTFSREGFRFTGWNTKANGDGDTYEDGGEAEFAEDTDLYAQWEKVMDHEHFPLTKVDAVEPGCESEGNKQYYVCEHCGKIYEDPEGQIELDKESVILKATGHRWDEGTEIQEPTYEEEGIIRYTCLNDPSHTREETIPKKTKPAAPSTVVAGNCTTADNNDGRLIGVTTAMEYKKADATGWTAGTGGDITGLVPGTYYVRLKETDTTCASDNQELTISEYVVPAYDVIYRVVGGTWADGSTADRTETVQSGSKPAGVPTGMKASEGFEDGSWDTDPADAEITGEKTFTYTFTAKRIATVTEAPTAKNLIYNGQAQELVNAGEAENGTMFYAVTGEDDPEPDASLYTSSIPAETGAGTYHVWYKACDKEKNNESEPEYVSVTIHERMVIHFHANGGTGRMDDQNVVTGDETKLNANTFSREGFRFAGWNTKANGDGDSYEDGEEALFTEETDLYAQWEKVMDHNHFPLTKVDAVEPGCESEGNKPYYVCEHCGKIYEDAPGQVELDKTDVILKATGHRWDEGTEIQEPTYEEEGIIRYTCLNDPSHTREEKIPKKTKPDQTIDGSGNPGSGEAGNGVQSDIEDDTHGSEDNNRSDGDDNRSTEDVNGTRVKLEGDVRDYDDYDDDNDDDNDDESSESYRDEESFRSGLEGNVPLISNRIPEHHQAESGVPVSDAGGHWDLTSGSWTYTKSDGTPARNEWLNLNYNGLTYWYDFDENGIMRTSWFDYGGEKYYFMTKEDGWRGRMATGWKQIDGKWYYFDEVSGSSQGKMFHAAVTPDGHRVGADGAWDGVGTTPVGHE